MNNKSKFAGLKLTAVCLVVLLLMFMMATWQDLSRLQNTRDDGIWTVEILTSGGEVTAVGEIHFHHKGRDRVRPYNIEFTIDATGEHSHSTLDEDVLSGYFVGDRVTVTREVYYLKPGFRIYTRDFVSKG